jgi:succinate dehydrogenase / fumarate reductase cytochrome b subunit
MSETKVKKERPLSPHLQIYKPQITSVSSIFHRMSGIALALGLFIMVWGLVALAGGRESFEKFLEHAASPVGQIVLIAWSAAFFYHMCTGIRHFILDAGYLYEKETAARSGWMVIALAALFTAALWGSIYGGLI